MHEREWAELGKIDYFLEQLARAVERGEVHRSSYDILAPRYLTRRAELVSVIDSHARRAAEATGVQEPAVVEAAPATAAARPTHPTRDTAAADPTAPAPVAATAVPRKRFSWTTALIITGAFLVINAAGLFVLAAWDVFGVAFQVLFLTTMTAAFYAAGMLVRKKLKQSVGGAALVVVGSALLLFDGWLLIDVFGLSGPWPWAAWLLLCSAVYWFTETRMAGGFFGVIGAAAQVVWWWLLGEGLGWDPLPRLAGIAVVAAVWTIAARRGHDSAPLASIARVLRYAGPVLMSLVLLGALAALGEDPASVPLAVFCLLVIAWAGTAVSESGELPRPLGAIAHTPLVLVALGALFQTSGWMVAALLAVGAVTAVAYETRRGGTAHGATAPLLAASALSVAAASAHAGVNWQVGLVAGVGAAFVIASNRIRRVRPSGSENTAGLGSGALLQPHRSLPIALSAGGHLVLIGATIALLPVLWAVPLSGGGFAMGDALTVSAFFGLWLAAALAGRSPLAAVGAILMSLLTLASILDVSNVLWDAPVLALPFVGLLFVWLLVRDQVERLTGLPAGPTAMLARTLTLVAVGAGLGIEAIVGDPSSATGAILLAAGAMWWFADRALTGERWALIPAAGLTVWAAGHLGWWYGGTDIAAITAAAAATAGVGVCVWLRERPGFAVIAPWSFVAAGLVALPAGAWNPAALAVAALLLAAAAALAVATSRLWWGLVGALALLTVSALAALAHFDPASWVTSLALVALGWACLLPMALDAGRRGGDATTITHALAVGGALSLLALIGLGAVSSGGATIGWADLYGHPLVFGLVAFGAYILLVAVRTGLELGFYLGVGVLLFALFVELDVLDARWVELYSTPAALYVAWCGYRWASRDGKRTVPMLADVSASVIALGVPFFAMLTPGIPVVDSWVHTLAAFGLALAGIALGVVLRVRAYFFAGIAAVVITALARTWDLLLLLWWLLLGIVGTAMIVVALARELREAMASGVRDLLDGWR